MIENTRPLLCTGTDELLYKFEVTDENSNGHFDGFGAATITPTAP